MPWPQPVVTVRFCVFSSRSARPLRVVDRRPAFDVPVDLHGDDVLDALDEPLVAQVADRERLGRRAERHQRHDLALVDVERQRMLAGDRRVARRAVSRRRASTVKVDGRAASVSSGR